MEVKKGYKQTEVGIIPDEWSVVTFGNVVDYVKGFAFKSADYAKSGVRIIRISDTDADSIKKSDEIFISEGSSRFAVDGGESIVL